MRTEHTQALERFEEGLKALRRDFHAHPELSHQEHRTATVIAEQLERAGLEVRTGIAGTGVVGILRGDKPGRTIAWRADIDALPLEEALDLPFKSTHPGVMHACGHDGHTAIALCLAEALAEGRRELPGTAVFLFQPAEEVFGGAKPMIEAGVLEEPLVEEVYGLHLTTRHPVGHVAVSPGPVMASADFFDIDITGMGGHGAFPYLSIDPITVAAHIVVGMQDLVSREVAAMHSAVLTVGQIEGGAKHNIIPQQAALRGSIRAFEQSVRDQLVERLGAYASRMAQAYRAEARMKLVGMGTPAVVNHEAGAEHVHRCACSVVGEANVSPGEQAMGSDDMALFLRERPGAYYWVGITPDGKAPMPHHHPAFEMDEAGLLVGLKTAEAIMQTALGR